MTPVGMSDTERHVWSQLPVGTRSALVERLSRTELQSLLLAVARERARTVRPADLLRHWQDDRFVRPAATDPRALAAVEARMWQLLPAEVEGVELSPVAPLGTCSALAPVSQNNTVATIRLTEVVSDASNALAIEAAARRRRQPAAGEVHLATSHRQLRSQAVGAQLSAHFRLFTLVSSARDTGAGRTQARLLILHLGYWRRVLGMLLPAARPQLRLTVFDRPAVRKRVDDTVRPVLSATGTALGAVPLIEEPARRRGRGYYVDAAVRCTIRDGRAAGELGDGGFTTWTSQLLSDAKERCLVSCLATERLAAAAGDWLAS